MTANSVRPSYPVFFGLDAKPLEAGFIYVGLPGADAESAPIEVFWDKELTIPAAQPIRTQSGFPENQGAPGVIYADGDYSLTVKNRHGEQVYTSRRERAAFGAVLDSVGDVFDDSLDLIEGRFGDEVDEARNQITVALAASRTDLDQARQEHLIGQRTAEEAARGALQNGQVLAAAKDEANAATVAVGQAAQALDGQASALSASLTEAQNKLTQAETLSTQFTAADGPLAQAVGITETSAEILDQLQATVEATQSTVANMEQQLVTAQNQTASAVETSDGLAATAEQLQATVVNIEDERVAAQQALSASVEALEGADAKTQLLLQAIADFDGQITQMIALRFDDESSVFEAYRVSDGPDGPKVENVRLTGDLITLDGNVQVNGQFLDRNGVKLASRHVSIEGESGNTVITNKNYPNFDEDAPEIGPVEFPAGTLQPPIMEGGKQINPVVFNLDLIANPTSFFGGTEAELSLRIEARIDGAWTQVANLQGNPGVDLAIDKKTPYVRRRALFVDASRWSGLRVRGAKNDGATIYLFNAQILLEQSNL